MLTLANTGPDTEFFKEYDQHVCILPRVISSCSFTVLQLIARSTYCAMQKPVLCICHMPLDYLAGTSERCSRCRGLMKPNGPCESQVTAVVSRGWMLRWRAMCSIVRWLVGLRQCQ